MTQVKRWTVEITIDEHEDELRTHAEARLNVQDRTELRGEGTARRNPTVTSRWARMFNRCGEGFEG